MKKRTAQFLNISLVLVSILCILLILGQTVYMNWTGEEAIHELGVFYMSGITTGVSSNFGTIIELRLSQVESLVNAVPPGRVAGFSPMQIELTYNARAAGFEYLALYTGDGAFEMLYGAQVTPTVPEALRRSVQSGKENVCAGTDAAGTPVILMGVPAIYPLEGGGESVALVAGLPTSYLKDTLESNVDSSIVEYAIIRNDGSYVLRNGNVEDDTYFERIERSYGATGGIGPEQYAAELRAAMEAGVDYTSEVLIAGERWNVYCTSLPDSEWNLILKISHNTMNETVKLLQRRWSGASAGVCALIACMLLLVFVGYHHQTKAQMQQLDEARQAAELARQTAEQAQQAAERSNKAKNEFLSNMSHDIRTPMNGIMGMTSIAIDSLDDPPRVHSCLKKIHVSSRHLLGLISDMLDMSKIESGRLTLNMEPLSLREITQNITTIIQPQIVEKNQSFEIYVHDIYHENVCSDRVRLSQILLNILGNAVKYTPEGGAIEAELYEEASPRGAAYIRSHLYIRDNGIGMSKEFLTHVFEPFAREDSTRVDKEAGAGMGLAITKHIVDTMGGEISVESELGKGTQFHIVIDMELSAQQDKELRLPCRNVLVVDDDPLAGGLAVTALDSIGLNAHAEADIGSACREVERRRSAGDPIHILLLDNDLPGQDGLAAARELSKRFGPELPVLLLTDGEWDEMEKRAEQTDVSGFISKPLFRSGLYYALRPFVEKDAPPPLPEPKEKAADIDLTGRRVLMAEDNDLNWEIANELLSACGLEMERAENGKVCVDKFRASAPDWYDAILMDLRMPVMTGFEAAVALRKLERKDARAVPIIAVSADTFQDDIQKCLDYGMNAHTAKPIDPDAVLRLLASYIQPKGGNAR
ncbi:MAG: response regulator [Subdoligranulum sp.]|nr:response regulator [Subdoligranulum sp.]